MTYVTLGGRKVAAAADTTGLNSGNLTAAFTPQLIGVNITYYEIYHIVLATAVAGKTFTPAPCHIFIEGLPYTFTFPNGGTEWDPAQPMLMRNGQEIDFCFGLASSVTPVPVVTIYMRYDPALPGLWGL